MKTLTAGLSLILALALAVALAAAQGPLDTARELYEAAAYEDALDVLAKMETAGPEIASTEAEVLKAFCLLALRRDADARSVIEGVVIERPAFVPGEEDASPRIRAEFREVRRKLLPSVTRQLYQSARDDYEKKNLVSAAAKFSELLKVLDDPELASDRTLSDLRLLAEGFRVVSAAAANVATAADTQSQRAAATEVGAAGNGGAARGSAPDSSSPTVASPTALAAVLVPVTPPVAINQKLPPWRDAGSFTRGEFTGAIDFVVDEQGRVESVSLRRSVHPLYDQQLVEAAKTWTYQPARRGDKPVKFQKTLVVRLNSR